MLHPDKFNRPISYLRVSVTDRCNLRCIYCMPFEGVCPMSHSELLTYEAWWCVGPPDWVSARSG